MVHAQIHHHENEIIAPYYFFKLCEPSTAHITSSCVGYEYQHQLYDSMTLIMPRHVFNCGVTVLTTLFGRFEATKATLLFISHLSCTFFMFSI